MYAINKLTVIVSLMMMTASLVCTSNKIISSSQSLMKLKQHFDFVRIFTTEPEIPQQKQDHSQPNSLSMEYCQIPLQI